MKHSSLVREKYQRKMIISGIILLLSLLFINDDVVGATIAGFFAIVFSFFTIREAKASTPLLVLFAIIFYINLSSYVLGPLTRGISLPTYQWDLWNSRYDAIAMKCILVSSVVFYITLCGSNMSCVSFVNDEQLHLKNNSALSFLSLLLIIFICLYSFQGGVSSDGYVSNDNPLFEYALLLFVLAWYYSGRNKFIKIFWIACSIIYLGTALLAGDRSSAFMLMVVIALYKINHIKISRLFVLGLLGITFANLIAIYRDGVDTSSMLAIMSKGLQAIFSDTVGHSCYTGLTIYYYEHLINNQLELFGSWILSLFTGSLFVDRGAIELSALANQYNDNGGGGLFQPYFYLFFNYLGVAVGSAFVGMAITRIYKSSRNGFFMLLRYVIPAMSFRWYLYSPTTLFRACFLMFFIFYILFDAFDKLTHKR